MTVWVSGEAGGSTSRFGRYDRKTPTADGGGDNDGSWAGSHFG